VEVGVGSVLRSPAPMAESVQRDESDFAQALERGEIVRFARAPIELPPEEDQEFLRTSLAPYLARKNVSLYPEANRVTGLRAPDDVRERARRILSEHGARVRAFLESAMPAFTRGMRIGTSSFRPLEEEGRNLSPHASNELVHVDAGAYGATHGDRILRFFVNLNPARDRVWITKGSFRQLFAEHGITAGVRVGDLRPGAAERIAGGFLRAASGLFPMLRVLDTSPYDRRMRQFHNWMKDTESFQSSPSETISFPPFSAWMVLTDGVSHACIRGQHALVDTFLVPLANCSLRSEAPFAILAGDTAAT
jgi:3-deoxy-D-manno-oct-2-ulosonic acid (Kdo) hydroxylase